jgi:hypothetical protein
MKKLIEREPTVTNTVWIRSAISETFGSADPESILMAVGRYVREENTPFWPSLRVSE